MPDLMEIIAGYRQSYKEIIKRSLNKLAKLRLN